MITTQELQQTETRVAMRGGPGQVHIRHYFTPSDFGAKVRLCAELTIPPGSGIGTHVHEGEDEVYLVQKGSGTLNDNGVETPVAAGDSILTGKGASHSIRNTGTTDLVITAIIIQY